MSLRLKTIPPQLMSHRYLEDKRETADKLFSVQVCVEKDDFQGGLGVGVQVVHPYPPFSALNCPYKP
jgi:hypothetical protein